LIAKARARVRRYYSKLKREWSNEGGQQKEKRKG